MFDNYSLGKMRQIFNGIEKLNTPTKDKHKKYLGLPTETTV